MHWDALFICLELTNITSKQIETASVFLQYFFLSCRMIYTKTCANLTPPFSESHILVKLKHRRYTEVATLEYAELIVMDLQCPSMINIYKCI